MPIVDITRDKFLEFAQELCSAVASMKGDADRLLKETKHPLTDRDRVLIGLALKMESSFHSLMDDVRLGRGEAMPHLKTMVEAFLYLRLVIEDPTPMTAHRVMAEVIYRKSKFMSDNPGYAREGDAAWWAAQVAEFEKDGIRRIGFRTTLEALVRHNSVLRQWYKLVYQAACEPAHITDLVDFMPDPEDPNVRGGSEFDANLRGRFAIEHGLWLLLGTLRSVRDDT
jgi:hypothetical protein